MQAFDLRRLLDLLETMDQEDKAVDDSELVNGNAPGYTYYHGTTTRAYEDHIQHEGLDPNHTNWEDDEASAYDDLPGPHRFIYLGLSAKTAADFGSADYNKGGETSFVILRVRPTPDIESKFIFDRGEYIRSPVLIPAHCISLYKRL